MSAGGLEGIRKGWEVGRGTGRGSYGNCSRPGTKGRERKRLPKAWELEQCQAGDGPRWRKGGPWPSGVTQPAILALGQQRQTGRKVKVIMRDTG